MKILTSIQSQFTLLLFLVICLGDCLHWYTLPKSDALHRGLYVGLIILSCGNCLLFVRNLNAMRQLWEKTRLKLISAPAEIETKFESYVRWPMLSVMSAIWVYVCAAIWGGIYLNHGPYLVTGYLALLVLVAHEVICMIYGIELARIRRRKKSRGTKTRPEQPAA